MSARLAIAAIVRQHLGDNRNDVATWPEDAKSASFVGRVKEFAFDCPGVDSTSAGVLMFEAAFVRHGRHRITVNGTELPGGFPRSAATSNYLIIPEKVLETSNVMRVEARNTAGGKTGDIDDFLIDNIAILYQS